MIKSRRMTWAVYVTRMGEKSNAYRILVGKPGKTKVYVGGKYWDGS
jgi:hypothetical protein